MFGVRNLINLSSQLAKNSSTVRISSKLCTNKFVICHVQNTSRRPAYSYRHFTQSSTNYNDTTTKSSETTKPTENSTPNIGEYDMLTEYHAYDMIYKLSDNDRASLSKALSKYDSDKIKSKFQGQLASSKWRLKFGRRSNEHALGAVDPTGTYCAMPDDWIKKKLAAAAVRPSNRALLQTFMVNGVPFIGFGFLDNFLMILAGDYIEGTIGAYMCLTTMAAAALGNTISDVFGLGLATYVEQFCTFCGLEAPNLTPTQQNMAITQRCGSLGRVVGITVGCVIGMFPLLFK